MNSELIHEMNFKYYNKFAPIQLTLKDRTTTVVMYEMYIGKNTMA